MILLSTIETTRINYRWIILALLWLLYSAFGMVSRAISPLVTPILNDLSISYSQMGLILGSWQLTYICAALVAGAIIDRWGVRKSIFVGAAIIGFSAVLRYFATGFLTLMMFVALFGVGGPMISIGGPKAISQWFNDRNRATAIGIYTAGNWIGGLLALALTISLVMPYLQNSWRATFVCYGLLTFLFCAFWGLMARESRATPPIESIGIFEVFQTLIRVRNVQILLLMALSSFAIGHGLILELRQRYPQSALLFVQGVMIKKVNFSDKIRKKIFIVEALELGA